MRRGTRGIIQRSGDAKPVLGWKPMLLRLTLVIGGLCVAVPSAAVAQQSDWYLAGGLGRIATRYHPAYDNLITGEADNFTNKADGLEAHFALGRDFFSRDRLSLAIEASASVNDENWSLFIPPEPAVLDFRLPYAILVSALPELAITKRLGITAQVGGGLGRIHEVKTSPTTSSYDEDELVPLLGVGGGLSVAATERVELFVRYRHLRYSSFEWDSQSPTGGVVEHVRDTPRSHAFWMGVAARF